MKNNIKEVQAQFPQFTIEEIRRLNNILANIRYRCDRHEHYIGVQCKFTLSTFLQFILDEKTKGRDYQLMHANGERPSIARLFDVGEYSPENCQVLSCAQNVKDAHCKTLKVYDSLSDQTSTFAHGIKTLWEINKHKLPSLPTMYRYIYAGKHIPVTNEYGQSGFIKITIA
ncbi:hypothetical protein DDN72_17375 [Vibrio cholerae]|nr:hypothetical protein [Vibrio cholerae]